MKPKKHRILRFLAAFVVFLAVAVAASSIGAPRITHEHGLDGSLSGAPAVPTQTPGGDGLQQAPGGDGPLAVVEEPGVPAGGEAPAEQGGPGGPDGPEGPEDSEDSEDPAEAGPPAFEPYPAEGLEPERMLASSAIMSEGKIVDSFSFAERIDFGYGEDYALIEGITTFRGNNLRDAASFGFADFKNAQFGEKWTMGTGTLTAPDGVNWFGHGWTGQPLIVKWPKQTRGIMNMHDWAKEQDELVEVIYAAMDGYVYFAELETGKATRNKYRIGFTFKGSGAVDPRGYPLLYVGAGYNAAGGAARIFIISLVDGSVLHTFGHGDPFAPRGWTAADAAPLIDAENDRLIYPSENGVIYIIDLNSKFDVSEGTVSIDPSSPVKWRYKGIRSQNGGYWLGMESSPAIWRGCLFIADNGGHLICLDLNTLEPVWVRDVLDDTNDTPVLEIEDGHPYLYISTGFHGGWRAPMNSAAAVPIWKIDAATGEAVWQTDYMCYTSDGVSGGVQGTIAVGKNALSGLIFVPVARTPAGGSGILAALDKQTGEAVWEFGTRDYAWSSPVCVYDEKGNGRIIYCTAGGTMYMLDGLTGEKLDSMPLGGTTEASPAVYGSTVVIGTRSLKIWGVKLT